MHPDIYRENANLLYHVPTVRVTHFMGTVASRALRSQGDMGCIAQEALHANSVRQKVEDTIGFSTIAAIGAVTGYVIASTLIKR